MSEDVKDSARATPSAMASPTTSGSEPAAANYPAINLQYRLDMAAAAFRAILHSEDRALVEAFAKAGLDYASGDEEALSEGAAFAAADTSGANDPPRDALK